MDKTIQHQLIDRCRRNNREAQLQLYRQYCKAMFHTANRLMGNVEDAEDVMQEAFLKAFQKIDQYQEEVSFGAWLKKIVVNKCFDALKLKKRRLLTEEAPMIGITSDDTNWEIDDKLSIEEVKKTMFTLPEKYSQVVVLFLIEGYSHEEIAQILNITIISSRTRLLRGKQKLKALLKHQYYGSGY